MESKKYLLGSDQIPLAIVADAIASSTLEEIAIGRELLVHHCSRIAPKPDFSQYYESIIRYYILCIERPITEMQCDLIHSRFEAAKELQRLFEFLNNPSNRRFVEYVELLVHGITESFENGDKTRRNVIETGFLEHVFEVKEQRMHFEHWRIPPFKETFDASTRWGNAHSRDGGEG